MEIITAIVAGILALIGAYAGSRIERATRHQTWLLEKRAEIFSEFLKILNKCKEEASLHFRKGPETGIKGAQELLDIYFPAFDYGKIVRLFLKQDSRDYFEGLIRKIHAIHSQKEFGDSRLTTFENLTKELQAILEEQLKDPKW